MLLRKGKKVMSVSDSNQIAAFLNSGWSQEKENLVDSTKAEAKVSADASEESKLPDKPRTKLDQMSMADMKKAATENGVNYVGLTKEKLREILYSKMG